MSDPYEEIANRVIGPKMCPIRCCEVSRTPFAGYNHQTSVMHRRNLDRVHRMEMPKRVIAFTIGKKKCYSE